MPFEPICISKIFEKSAREEAINDYASLAKENDYSETVAALYSELYRRSDTVPINLSAEDLKAATVTKGHDCDYIREKYGTADLCAKCLSRDNKNNFHIRADSADVTDRNIIEIASLRTPNRNRKTTPLPDEEVFEPAAEKEEENEPAVVPVIEQAEEIPAADTQEEAPTADEPLTEEENAEAEERERRLLIYILGQTAARVKAVLPTDEEDMMKIKARFVSKTSIPTSDGTYTAIPINAAFYQTLYEHVAFKIAKGQAFIKGISEGVFLRTVSRDTGKEIAFETIKDGALDYFNKMLAEANVFTKEYANSTDAEKRKRREAICEYFKDGSRVKKTGKSTKKSIYEGNASLLDMEKQTSESMAKLDTQTCDLIMPDTNSAEAPPCDITRVKNELALLDDEIWKRPAEDQNAPEEYEEEPENLIPETLEAAAEEEPAHEEPEHTVSESEEPEKDDTPCEDTQDVGEETQSIEETPDAPAPEPEVNPHAVIEFAMFDEMAAEIKQQKKPEKSEEETDKTSEEAQAENIAEETPAQDSPEEGAQETAAPQKKTYEKKPIISDIPSFSFEEQSLEDSMFTDEGELKATSDKRKKEKLSPKPDIVIKDNNNGNYSYEFKVNMDWLNRNGFTILGTTDESKNSRTLMYAFLRSYVTGVEVARRETADNMPLFLLFFEDIGERYAVKPEGNHLKACLKKYLSDGRLFKKVSTCPIAVFAACNQLGFMAQNISYAEGYRRPLGAFAPKTVISEAGFSAYDPENWKQTRLSRSDAKEMCFEQALSRSLYANGKASPLFSVEDNEFSFEKLLPDDHIERIILYPQLIGNAREKDFKRLIDETIRRLEKDNVFFKYRTILAHLDYSKMEVAFAMAVSDYRAFRNCINAMNIMVVNKLFRAGEISPSFHYETERQKPKADEKALVNNKY